MAAWPVNVGKYMHETKSMYTSPMAARSSRCGEREPLESWAGKFAFMRCFFTRADAVPRAQRPWETKTHLCLRNCGSPVVV
jgi:hypothetical protein